jgi:DNA repair protein RadC
VLNHLGDVFSNDPNKLQQLYQLGEQKITDAAKDSELAQRAEENTRKMLDGMLRSLGYTSITITFAAP